MLKFQTCLDSLCLWAVSIQGTGTQSEAHLANEVPLSGLVTGLLTDRSQLARGVPGGVTAVVRRGGSRKQLGFRDLGVHRE